jgi:hypothetical protein
MALLKRKVARMDGRNMVASCVVVVGNPRIADVRAGDLRLAERAEGWGGSFLQLVLTMPSLCRDRAGTLRL